MESHCTPEEAAPLIARGAVVDVFAAAHLGMFDRVRELVERDPSLVHARGGDGKTPLHCARTVEIARFLHRPRRRHRRARRRSRIDAGAVSRPRCARRDAAFSSSAAPGSTSSSPSACAMPRSSSDACGRIRKRSITAPGRASTRWRTTASGRRRARRSAITAATSIAGCSTTTSPRSTSPHASAYDDIVGAARVACLAGAAAARGLRARPIAPPPEALVAVASGCRSASLTRAQMRLIVDKAHANDTCCRCA